ncbi:TetR family transcriptional regulator [Humitalea rosea]|uniref:TetR family transcriptional regulator n=1 Tax=Humitalea rosea TaxID=990373 RepID=A0A2W7J0G4_9PROT|nr:TetR/AcrR family transcriptional regulator [Humitalea rosea]PZW45101.1 TetR family transcriptional regulator [Humitalea rosea]
MSAEAAARRPVRRTRRGDEKSEQIRLAAAEMFLERGFDGVSLDEIVKAVGGSKANVYTHFGNKEGLFAAVVEGLCEGFLASVVAIDASGLSPEEGLARLARALVETLLQDRHLAFHRLMIAESGRFPALGRVWFESGPETSRRALARFVAAQQRAGRLDAGDPHRAATLFHDMVTFNLLVRAMLGDRPSEGEIGQTIDAAVAVFLRGYAGRSIIP